MLMPLMVPNNWVHWEKEQRDPNLFIFKKYILELHKNFMESQGRASIQV